MLSQVSLCEESPSFCLENKIHVHLDCQNLYSVDHFTAGSGSSQQDNNILPRKDFLLASCSDSVMSDRMDGFLDGHDELHVDPGYCLNTP